LEDKGIALDDDNTMVKGNDEWEAYQRHRMARVDSMIR
jgi:hypothetical protein